MTRRSNEQWLTHLNTEGLERKSALEALRSALLQGLRASLHGRAQADEAFLEDVVQDALLLVLDRLRQFEGRSGFVTWATSIAVRVALTDLRRARWKDVSLTEIVGDSAGETIAYDDESDTVEKRQTIERLYEVIRSDLTEKQRIALLAEMKGMSQEEIARQLGSNRNAVYKLTHDARKRLKRGLESSGYDAETIRTTFTT